MANKSCGECRFLIPEYDRHGRGKCYHTDNRHLPSCGACKAFVERYGGNQPTNGDKIRQGGNRELAELIWAMRHCRLCIYHDPREIVCNRPGNKTCVDGIESWLNAPAESQLNDAIQNVIKDGAKNAIDIHEAAYAPDMNVANKESEGEDE